MVKMDFPISYKPFTHKTAHSPSAMPTIRAPSLTRLPAALVLCPPSCAPSLTRLPAALGPQAPIQHSASVRLHHGTQSL